MKKYFLLTIFLCLCLLSGCNMKSFTPIPKEKEILISVNIKEGSLTFFDLKNKKRFTEWKLNQPVKGAVLFPDRNKLLVYGNDLEVAYVYNLAEGKVEQEWKIGKGIVNAVFTNDFKHLVLVDQNRQSIRLFTMKGKEIGEVEVGKKPLTILQNERGNLLYVMNFNEEFINVVDIQRRETIDRISIPKSSTGGLIREAQNELWVGGHGSGEHVQSDVHIYSLKTGELIEIVPAPEMPIHFVETDQGVFVLSHGSNTIRKYDLQKREIASLIVGSNPFSMIAHGDKLYIASYDSNEIYQVDQERLQVLGKFQTGKGPFQLIYREGDLDGKEKSTHR
jgi:hypothetical protein